jgi:hypothetical protein
MTNLDHRTKAVPCPIFKKMGHGDSWPSILDNWRDNSGTVSVKALALRALERDKPWDRSETETLSFVPVPSFAWDKWPEEYSDGLSRLAHISAPAGFPPHRWLAAKTAALTFARQWLWQAIRLGWTPLELFGLHAVAPAARHDAKGVAWILEGGGRVLAMTEGTAAIMAPTGSMLTFYRRQAIDGAVLPWELTDRPEITACGSRK